MQLCDGTRMCAGLRFGSHCRRQARPLSIEAGAAKVDTEAALPGRAGEGPPSQGAESDEGDRGKVGAARPTASRSASKPEYYCHY